MPRYDQTTALIIVDVQNDFADPSGSLSVPAGAAVVPVINEEIAAAMAAAATVVCSQDWHPRRTPHFQTDGGPWPLHCVAGSWGAELHPDSTRPTRHRSAKAPAARMATRPSPSATKTASRSRRIWNVGCARPASSEWSSWGWSPTTA